MKEVLKVIDSDQKDEIFKKLVVDLFKEINFKFCKKVNYIIGNVILKDSVG